MCAVWVVPRYVAAIMHDMTKKKEGFSMKMKNLFVEIIIATPARINLF